MKVPFTRTSSVQDLPVILKWHNLQSLDKALDFFIELNFCKSDLYSLNSLKKCKVAIYNFGSVYMYWKHLFSKIIIKALVEWRFQVQLSHKIKGQYRNQIMRYLHVFYMSMFFDTLARRTGKRFQ